MTTGGREYSLHMVSDSWRQPRTLPVLARPYAQDPAGESHTAHTTTTAGIDDMAVFSSLPPEIWLDVAACMNLMDVIHLLCVSLHNVASDHPASPLTLHLKHVFRHQR